MTTFVFANNISTQLASPVSSSDTTITLASITGFPSSIPAGSVLEVTLNDQATHTVFEILYATAITGSTLTVLRAQEGTTALSWSTGDIVFSGPTAGQMQSFSSPNLAAYSLFGNPTGSTAPAEAVTLGTSLAFSGTTLITEPTTFNLTLDVTGSASLVGGTTVNLAATIGAGTVTTAKMAALAANTLIANPTGSSAVPQAVTLANGLAFSGTTLGMGDITPNTVTSAGAITATTGAITCVTNFTASTSTANLNTTGAGTISLRPNGQGVATGQVTIAASGAVTTNGMLTVNGTITSTGTVNFNTSDRHLKKNIKLIRARPIHRHVRFVSYDRKDIIASGRGSIAQEVQKFDPSFVNEYDHAAGKRTVKRLAVDQLGMAYEQAIWAGEELDRQAKVIASQAALIEKLVKRIEKLEQK